MFSHVFIPIPLYTDYHTDSHSPILLFPYLYTLIPVLRKLIPIFPFSHSHTSINWFPFLHSLIPLLLYTDCHSSIQIPALWLMSLSRLPCSPRAASSSTPVPPADISHGSLHLPTPVLHQLWGADITLRTSIATYTKCGWLRAGSNHNTSPSVATVLHTVRCIL